MVADPELPSLEESVTCPYVPISSGQPLSMTRIDHLGAPPCTATLTPFAQLAMLVRPAPDKPALRHAPAVRAQSASPQRVRESLANRGLPRIITVEVFVQVRGLKSAKPQVQKSLAVQPGLQANSSAPGRCRPQ